ncbi:MAG: YihY/virulence factor BrkB family protein [Bacilli bacterium]|nr:YihY/virulence factor BrkB family protein [Bacilli bacterium]
MKRKIKGYFKKLFKILSKPEMAILPSNIAFNLILAIIPILTIIVLIASSFDISIDLVTKLVQNIMPEQVSSVIIDVISGKGFDTNVGISNILAFFLASNGTYAIITASDTLYKVDAKDKIKKRISSLIILLIIITLLLFLVIVPMFGENIISLMHKAQILENYIDEITIIFNIFKWPLTLFIIYFNIKLIYTIAPSKNVKSKETTYGALFTTIMWIIATAIFKFYLTYFARYDILYGNLSSIIIMLVWCYFLSFIFVLGMAINASQKEEQEFLEETKRIALTELTKETKRRKKKEKQKEKN